jgi:hypothetical protein
MTQPWIKLPDLHPLRIHSHWALGKLEIHSLCCALPSSILEDCQDFEHRHLPGAWRIVSIASALHAVFGSAALAHRSSFS